jgi:hypothetical protein
VWTADGQAIVIKTGEQGSANLVRVDAATGRLTPLTTGAQEIVGYTADASAARLAVIRSTCTAIGDLGIIGRHPDRLSRGADRRGSRG